MKNVPEMKPMITASWKKRLELMKELTKRQASESLHLKIEERMASSQNKEEMAELLLKQIKNKTEEEALKAISTM